MELKTIYKSDSEWNSWEAQLVFEKEFVNAAILLKDDKKIIGQVIIYHNPYHEIDGESCICMGNIVLPDIRSVFENIHRASVEIAEKLKVKIIISPMDGSTWNNYRFVQYQHKAPFLLETTSEAYFLDQFKGIGYKTLASYFSHSTAELTDLWDKCKSRYEHFVDEGMKFEPFNLSDPESEFRSLALFCNQAFRKNFLFSPIQEDDFVQKMMQFIPILNPAYVLIARLNGDIAGFIFAYQDLTNRKEKTLIVKTMARDIDKPYGGLGTLLGSLIMKEAIRDRFTHCIHALMIENNSSKTISTNFHGETISRYELLYYTI